MSPTKVLLATLCMAMGALAFAADPTPPATTSATPPGSTDTASAAAADKAAADKAAADKAKSAATNAKTEPGGITADQAKTLRIAGYKASVQKGGQVVYCRSEPKAYSLIETKVCGAPNDILLSIDSSKEQVKQLQRANH
ncbi:MAG TPA: hypothetical protein VIY68_19435 [Steroidobacteraceae bacterium]